MRWISAVNGGKKARKNKNKKTKKKPSAWKMSSCISLALSHPSTPSSPRLHRLNCSKWTDWLPILQYQKHTWLGVGWKVADQCQEEVRIMSGWVAAAIVIPNFPPLLPSTPHLSRKNGRQDAHHRQCSREKLGLFKEFKSKQTSVWHDLSAKLRRSVNPLERRHYSDGQSEDEWWVVPPNPRYFESMCQIILF